MERDKHFNTTGYSAEKFSRMLDAGFTVKEIERAWADEEYRREYNQRDYVKAKRTEYNRKRWERMKEIKKLGK